MYPDIAFLGKVFVIVPCCWGQIIILMIFCRPVLLFRRRLSSCFSPARARRRMRSSWRCFVVGCASGVIPGHYSSMGVGNGRR
jgi:hypothetical protein